MDAKADDDAKDESDNKELEDSETSHGLARLIEQEDEHHIENRYSASGYKGDRRDEKVQADRESDYLQVG